MKYRNRILAVGCILTLAAAPVTAYADTAEAVVQTSPRLGVTIVGSNEAAYANVAISRVSNYVNVRTEPNTTSGIVGKIYNNCAATILATVDGEGGTWYQIQSGTVNGYIKAEYFITGSEAEKIAKEVGTVYVTINTTTLRLREEPNTTSRTLTLLSQDAEYIALKEDGDFVEIQVDATLSGYVHKDYLVQRVEFEQAVSLEEERQKQEEAETLKKEADEAIAVLEQLKKEESASGGSGASESAGSAGSSVSAPTPSESIGIIAANPSEPQSSGAASQNGTTQNGASQAGQSGTSQTETDQGGSSGEEYGPGGGTGADTLNGSSGTNAGTSDGSAGTSGGSSGTVVYGQQTGPGGSSSGTVISGQDGPGASNSGSNSTSQTGPGSEKLTSATRTAIVAYAKQFLGNPYVYGGTSLTEGADCSGFTMRIFENFGIETGRTSRDQAANGKEISISDVQPGDLVFYASGDYINHVAIYIGGGQIIHASTPKNGITTTTMYYRTPYKAVTFLN